MVELHFGVTFWFTVSFWRACCSLQVYVAVPAFDDCKLQLPKLHRARLKALNLVYLKRITHLTFGRLCFGVYTIAIIIPLKCVSMPRLRHCKACRVAKRSRATSGTSTPCSVLSPTMVVRISANDLLMFSSDFSLVHFHSTLL
jgi:hypothetical protein